MRPKYATVHICEWCVLGIESHGEKVFQGGYVGTGTCEFCGDNENDLYECLVEMDD